MGLKSKIYSFLKDGGLGDQKAKGINKNVVKKIKHDKYKDVWFGEKCVRHEMKRKEQIGLTRFLCHALMIKDIYLMMEIK